MIAALFAVGCGGGSGAGVNNQGPGIQVNVTSPTGAAALDDNQTLPITVSVSNDTANAGVTWAVLPAVQGGPVGTLTDAKALSGTYNPPPGLTSPGQVTVIATSVTDPTRSATVPISVYPALAISTQSSDLATAFIGADYSCIQTPIDSFGVIQIPCQVSVAGGLAPYTWSLGTSLLPDGLVLAPGLTANATKIVGQPTTSAIYPFSLTVTDSVGGTATVSLTINVAPSQLKVVTPTLLTTTVGAAYAPVGLQASGGKSPYTWSLAFGSGPFPPGMSLSPNGVISGTPTTSNSFFFAVQVKDSQTPVPAQAVFPAPAPTNAKIMTLTGSALDPTCLPGGSSILSATPYAFLFSGFDANGPVTISGSFTADSQGNLSGVEDIIRAGDAQLAQPLAAGSSIVFNQVGRGCLTLNTATAQKQFRVAPTTIAQNGAGAFFSDGRIVEFDDLDGTGTRGSGSFKIQDPTVFGNGLAGSYGLRFSGRDAAGGHFAMAGVATADNGLFTSVSADVNDAGSISGALTGGDGNYSSVDANGRGTATIAVGSGAYDLIYYLVDANHLILNSVHPVSSGHPLVTGEATSTAGPFNQGSLHSSYIYRLGGSLINTPDLGIGVLHFDGVSAISGMSFARTGGSTISTALSGQYAVDSNSGRLALSGTAIPAVGYLVSSSNGLTAYLVGASPAADSGVMEFQTDSYPPGYQFSPINGRYGFGMDEVLDPLTSVFAGVETLDLNGGISPDSYIDSSGPISPGLLPVQTYTLFRCTWSPDGSGTYGGNTFMVANGTKVFYIDTSPLNGHPAVVVGQRQQ